MVTVERKGIKKVNKLKYISITLLLLSAIILLVMLIWEIYDFKLDYRCSTMNYNKFIKDEKCEKYWGMR